MQVVRQSKFRHVFGQAFKPELTYQGLRPRTGASDCDWIKANSKYFALTWQSGGGGSIAVIKHESTGKFSPEVPQFTGHKAAITDFDFNPFNDSILATGSEDQTVKIWGIPEGGLTASTDVPLVELEGHDRKLSIVNFHPTANNVLVTAAFDNLIKLWDIEAGAEKASVGVHPDTIQSMAFNIDGSLMVTHAKDKKFRIIDPRAGSVATEAEGHAGTKGARVAWLRKLDRIYSVGFSKMSDRQFRLWDPRNMGTPLVAENIDQSAGALMPFFDEDSSLMFLAGKGDANIRYFEIEESAVHFVSNFTAGSPQRGMAMLPKVAVDVRECEIVRLLKLEAEAVVPISFTVPRKATDIFQADIFPDTFAPEAVVSADEFFSGKTAQPKTVSMKPGANSFSSAPKISDFKPKVAYKPKEKLPPVTSDPKALAAQNEELRKIIEKLQKENDELRAKLGN